MPEMPMKVGSGFYQFIALFYILSATAVFLICRYLLKFSGQIKTAIEHNRQDYLAHAFSNLKMVYKISGIIVLVVIGMFLLSSLLSPLLLKAIA